MTKLYQVQISGRHRVNHPTPYFSTEAMAVEQALVYLISASENYKKLCLETKTLESWFRSGYYSAAQSYDDSIYVSLQAAQIIFPNAGTICSLEQQFPQWGMLESAKLKLLDEVEEENSWIGRTVETYNEEYLKTANDNISDVIDCWDQRIKKLNEILDTIFDKDKELSKRLEKCQEQLVFMSGDIIFSQTVPLVLVKQSNITIDEVIGVD